MITDMNKLTLSVMLGIAGVIGCANQQAAPEPQTGPPGVDIEYRDRDEAAAPKSAEAEGSDEKPSSSDAKPSSADDTSSAKSESASKPAPVKKSCTEIKKKLDCEVMMGCAWSTDKVCVNQ